MQNNYDANMNLSYEDLNRIEDKVEELTEKVEQNIYSGSHATLRNIQVGDNLSGKTIYLSFPRDSYKNINSSSVDLVRMDNSLLRIYYGFNILKYISIVLLDPSLLVGITSFIYCYNTSEDTGNPYLNIIRFKLPNDFGTVTYINDSDELFKYIKIYDENIIPEYIKKTWVLNEIPYMQDIDRIEQGIKNLGDYFTKPVGWITPREWFKTNTLTDRSDYGVGSKGFSYIDINRWINNLNLIEQEDMDDVTIWNTNKTQYYWNEEDDE